MVSMYLDLVSHVKDSGERKEQFRLFAIPSLSREDCIKEQAADPTLKSLFELVLPENELKSVFGGYFFRDGLLLRPR